jgi:hypothetical protein
MAFIAFDWLVFALELEIMVICFLVKGLLQKLIGTSVCEVLIGNERDMVLVDSAFTILLGHF